MALEGVRSTGRSKAKNLKKLKLFDRSYFDIVNNNF